MTLQYSAFYDENGSTPIASVGTGAPPITSPLLMAPGTYSYNAPSYTMTSPGLYRFAHPAMPGEAWADCTNRIVVNGNTERLLSSLAYLVVHGERDEGLDLATRLNRLRTGWVVCKCGKIDEMVRSVLAGQSIQSRTAQFLTMQEPTNYDDGHVTTEVKINGEWCLYDITLDRRFKTQGGQPLSAKNAPAAIMGNTYTSEHITASKTGYDPAWYNTNAVWASVTFDRAGGEATWTSRIFQAVGLTQGSEVWWKLPAGYESRASWVEGLQFNWKVKDAATWDATFYP